MINGNFLYSYKYEPHHTELCKLESRQLFGQEERGRVIISNIEIDPSISPFIKHRLKIMTSSENYADLLQKIKAEKIYIDGFNAEYLSLEGDTIGFATRREKQKDIGYSIVGEPDFKHPIVVYSICNYEDMWYFGVLEKHDIDWHKHKQKPCSFSNSIEMYIGKALVSIASKGMKSNTLLDACCGAGTVLLEGCVTGFNIEGCEINPKTYEHTVQNLERYGYQAHVYCSDVKELNKTYDAAIIDLPYNLYSCSSDEIMSNIITATTKLTNRIVMVSISDIKEVIKESGLKIIDFCTVDKRGKASFIRNIWVCEKG